MNASLFLGDDPLRNSQINSLCTLDGLWNASGLWTNWVCLPDISLRARRAGIMDLPSILPLPLQLQPPRTFLDSSTFSARSQRYPKPPRMSCRQLLSLPSLGTLNICLSGTELGTQHILTIRQVTYMQWLRRTAQSFFRLIALKSEEELIGHIHGHPPQGPRPSLAHDSNRIYALSYIIEGALHIFQSIYPGPGAAISY